MSKIKLDKVFIPQGENRRETAVLLVGTADEHGISQSDIKMVNGGFLISLDLANVLYDEGVIEVDEEEGYSEEGEFDAYEVKVDDPEPEDIYLPADYSVAQVKDFVEKNPDQLDAVLLSERAGQNRATLVSWLEQASGNRAAKNSTSDKE